jgi:alpha-mannosidase
MLKHQELSEQRIRLASRRIFQCVYTQNTPLKASYLPSDEPMPWKTAVSKRFKAINPGEQWGDNFSCAWFRLSGRVTPDMRGKEVVALVDLGGEACLYDSRGTPVLGLTPKFDDRLGGLIGPKKEIKLLKSSRGREDIELLLDAGANHLLGSRTPARIRQAELAVFNPLAWKLYHEFRFLEQLMLELPQERHRQLLLRALNDCCNLIGTCSDNELAAARAILKPELQRPAKHSALNVSAIGHAHLDVAWLWPLRETVRKAARTFATALELMTEYPKYKFGASQPHLYQMVKDHYPGLYRKIIRAVKEGRWEVQGGMWVESDTNIPSGESLIRQLLHGKRFFQDEFGIEIKNLWLPDVFGYSAALPQILKKSGVDYFTTHKLNWNQFNKFPHHTMNWKGLDGTSIFAHFMAGNDYNAPCTPNSFMKYERENKDNDRSDYVLSMFGIGDGGGGPGRSHLEWLGLAADLEDLPRVTPEFASDFFTKAQESARDLLTWEGELYFEYHRGTYTTQALVKKQNRRMEQLLREVELAWSMLPLSRYPAKALDKAWKVVLLNQFHDIIPGSSINRVYREAHEQYSEVEKDLTELLITADQEWQRKINTSNLSCPYLLRNSLSWDRDELVLIPETSRSAANRGSWISADGEPALSQPVRSGTLVQVRTPALGHGLIGKGKPREQMKTGLQISKNILQNKLLRIELASNGNIKRIFDKTENREVLSSSAMANQFCLFEDRPLTYDAWDIDAYYMEMPPSHPRLINSEILEHGPLRASIQQTWRAHNYDIVQTIALTHDSRLISFDTRVDWRESNHMLRVQFPVNIHAASANYEIQFGHIARPTHMNTSWDMAKFEVVAHKWADISQPNYGVAIINDCKYGHQIQGNTISLNLLRSPKLPDAQADMHTHQFRYALLPHPGDLNQSDVIQRAYEFNVPIRAVRSESGRGRGATSNPGSFVTVNHSNVIIDTIKKAEGDRSLIVRMYEALGTDCSCEVSFPGVQGNVAKRIQIVSMMEDRIEDIETDAGRARLSFKPFEIKTLRLMTNPLGARQKE